MARASRPSRMEPAISAIATLTRSGTTNASPVGVSIFSFWYFLVTAVPCRWCLGGRPTPTSRPVWAGDRHLNFYETRDNLATLRGWGVELLPPTNPTPRVRVGCGFVGWAADNSRRSTVLRVPGSPCDRSDSCARAPLDRVHPATTSTGRKRPCRSPGARSTPSRVPPTGSPATSASTLSPRAAPNRLMVHLALDEADDEHAVVQWLTPVTDEEYGAAPATD